jgi:hypothetical protein
VLHYSTKENCVNRAVAKKRERREGPEMRDDPPALSVAILKLLELMNEID